MPDTSEDKFHAFVVARTPALSRTAYLLPEDAHLAEDLVQTALFKAAKAWHRIEGDQEPYVRRVLYTQNVSWWRQRRHVREQALGSYDVPARPADPDLRLTLEDALRRPTARQRTALVLRYFEDLTEVQTTVRVMAGSTSSPPTAAALALWEWSKPTPPGR